MKILLFFILTLISFASNTYVPKTEDEKNILKKYRSKELTLILDSELYKNQIFDGSSFNNIIKDLFENYLKLNIIIENRNDETKLNRKNIILGDIFENNSGIENIKYTEYLYKEDLYLVFDTKQLNVKKENPLFKRFFNFYRLYDNKNRELREIKNIDIENENYFLCSTNVAIDYAKKYKIGKLPNKVIGVLQENRDLIPILNHAINEKYRKKINDFLEKRKLNIKKNNFENTLTMEEKKYILKNKEIYVGLEGEQLYSFYSSENQKYIGSIPKLLESISDITNLKFVIKNKKEDNWGKILNLFFKKNI